MGCCASACHATYEELFKANSEGADAPALKISEFCGRAQIANCGMGLEP